MNSPRRDEGPGRAPSYHSTEDTQPGSSTANLTEEDIMGAGSGSGWRLDEIMDARQGNSQATAAAAASLQEDSDRNDFLVKPWPPEKLGRIVALEEVIAQQARISLATSDHPRPHVGTRHRKRKAAEASGAAGGQPQGLAGLADVASMLASEPSSKRAKTGSLVGRSGAGQPRSAPTGEGAAPSKPHVGQKGKTKVPKKQLEDLPYRRADGTWTCTFSTGGMNKNKLTLCGRDNEAKRSTCKACKAPRWDWQLRGRLAAILQRRDLHTLSLQQVMSELNKMSVVNCEGLRFPKPAVAHEVDAFLASSRHKAAGKLQQPTEVSSLPVFPRGLWKERCQVDERQAAGTSKLQWARNRGDSAPYEISIEEELATEPGCTIPGSSLNGGSLAGSLAQGFEAGALQNGADRAIWQPLYCALLRLAQTLLEQQLDQPAGSSAGSLLDAPRSLSKAEEAAEECCAFAHSLIEAALRRRWPSRLKLKKNMKGIQEHVLRLHLPYPKGPEAGSPAAGAVGAEYAEAHFTDDEDSLEHVQGVKRPLPFSSRAALMQNPPRRPKGWAPPPLPRPRIDPSGELMRPEQERLDTSGVEASSWLLAPPFALHQVQHACAPSAVAKPGSSAEPSSSHAAHAQASAGSAKPDGAGHDNEKDPEPASQTAPVFGQWDPGKTPLRQYLLHHSGERQWMDRHMAKALPQRTLGGLQKWSAKKQSGGDGFS
ncbi:g5122 [Coccomyxa viridis]|uniref:G5122 protein n=1 Tax=Coccomyxa viridis TaxID=1274662 RepID=A0ABP1FUB5_9CHLO